MATDPIHVFNQSAEDNTPDLLAHAVHPPVEVSASVAEAIAAVAESSGQNVHFHPEQGGDSYSYIAIDPPSE